MTDWKRPSDEGVKRAFQRLKELADTEPPFPPDTVLKTGFLPTLTAVITVFSKLAGPLDKWIVALSISIVVLQMLGLHMLMALHRVAALAELALEKLGD